MGVKKVAVFLFDKMTDYNLFTTTVLENTTNRNARRRRDDELINVTPSLNFHGTLDKKELTVS